MNNTADAEGHEHYNQANWFIKQDNDVYLTVTKGNKVCMEVNKLIIDLVIIMKIVMVQWSMLSHSFTSVQS